MHVAFDVDPVALCTWCLCDDEIEVARRVFCRHAYPLVDFSSGLPSVIGALGDAKPSQGFPSAATRVLDLAQQFFLLLFGERLTCSIHVFLSCFDEEPYGIARLSPLCLLPHKRIFR